MLPGISITFQPSLEAIDPLLDALGHAHLSLASLAAEHNTTVEALSLWMSTPDIAERLAQTDNITTWRTRLVASRNLSSAVATLTNILDDFNERHNDRATPRASDRGSERSVSSQSDRTTHPVPTPFQAALIACRTSECARKSASLLIRLGNFNPVGLPRPLAARDIHTTQPAHDRTTPPRPSAATNPLAHPEVPHTTPEPQAPAPAQPPTRELEPIHPTAATTPTAPAPAQPAPTSPAPADFESAANNLEELLFNLLGQRPDLEPALARFVSEMNQPARPP